MSEVTINEVIERLHAINVSAEVLAVEGVRATPAVVSSVTHDSRHVTPGSLFCCVPGDRFDGHSFAEGAVADGAAALLVERPLDGAISNEVTQILVSDVRRAMGPVAALVHGDPSRSLDVVGITGTNGKTSVVHLLGHVLTRLGVRARTMGTLSGARTTPEGPELQAALAGHVAENVAALAMEVSSHALSLHRVDGTAFRAAVFMNLGHDHLDFHHTMDEYLDAKALLFEKNFTPVAIINRDDEAGQILIERLQNTDDAPELLTFGLDDVTSLIVAGPESRFTWRGHDVVLRLAGEHNVSNALAAATVAEYLGHAPVDIADALCAADAPRGRFEFVNVGQPFHVIVDYAHKPEALTAVLNSARQVAEGREIHVVIGCGGDRDADKRPMMAAAAIAGADHVVFTSDNPRTEDPQAIIDAMLLGVPETASPQSVSTVMDRREAIDVAIRRAQPGDVVLIAGKGHEDYQEVMGEKLPFDDRVVAVEAILGEESTA